jgi:Mn-dependent DtxR family transcriptional regulator
MTGFALARSANSAKMAIFASEEAMKRDLMLMEAILGQLLQSPDPLIGTSTIAQRLKVELPIVRHHLNLLQDKGLVQESENSAWRLTNQGHDYLEGAPQQAISLNLPSK